MNFQFLESFKNLNDGQVDFYIDNLNKTLSKGFIEVLRKENICFSLEFKNLKFEMAKDLIKRASLNEEDIEVSKKYFSQLSKNNDIPVSEINELFSKGIEYLIDLKEKGSIPWRTIKILGSLALIQITAGIIFCCFGFTANIGIGLIAEGISDILMATIAYKTRKFNWKSYGIQKTISILVSIASLGVSQIGGEIVTEAVEQGVTQGIMNIKKIGAKALQVIGTKTGKIAVESLKRMIIIGAMGIPDKNQKFNPVLYKAQINEIVETIIRSKFFNDNVKVICILKKFYAFDSMNKNKNYEKKINSFLYKIAEKIESLLDKSIPNKLENMVLKFQNNEKSQTKFIWELQKLTELDNSIDAIFGKFTQELINLDKNEKMADIIHNNLKIKKQKAREYSKILREFNITDENDIISCLDLEDLKTKIEKLNERYGTEYSKIFTFLKSFLDQQNNIKNDEIFKNYSLNVISSAITEQLIQTTNLKMRFIENLELDKLILDPNMIIFPNDEIVTNTDCSVHNSEPSNIDNLVERVRNLQDLNSIIL